MSLLSFPSEMSSLRSFSFCKVEKLLLLSSNKTICCTISAKKGTEHWAEPSVRGFSSFMLNAQLMLILFLNFPHWHQENRENMFGTCYKSYFRNDFFRFFYTSFVEANGVWDDGGAEWGFYTVFVHFVPMLFYLKGKNNTNAVFIFSFHLNIFISMRSLGFQFEIESRGNKQESAMWNEKIVKTFWLWLEWTIVCCRCVCLNVHVSIERAREKLHIN